MVGDTPHDLEAARYAGAVSIAVASGHFTTGQLREAGAGHALAPLEEGMPI